MVTFQIYNFFDVCHFAFYREKSFLFFPLKNS
jgi:hypothetical protein